MLCCFRKLGDGQNPKKRDVSVNFSHAMFSHLDFLNLEDGTNKLSQNISKELLLFAV
jgi:hypothetical protein